MIAAALLLLAAQPVQVYQSPSLKAVAVKDLEVKSAWIKSLSKQDQEVVLMILKSDLNEYLRARGREVEYSTPAGGKRLGWMQVYGNNFLSMLANNAPQLGALLSESADNARMVLDGDIDRVEFLDRNIVVSAKMKSFLSGMSSSAFASTKGRFSSRMDVTAVSLLSAAQVFADRH